MSLLLIILSYIAGVVVHEFGHAVCGRLVGIPIGLVSIGDGPRLLHFKIRNTSFDINAYPMCGFCRPTEPWMDRGWRSVFFGLGGALGNLALIAMLFAFEASGIATGDTWSVIGLLIFVQCWIIAFCIVPMRGTDQIGLRSANDGYLLWTLLHGKASAGTTFMEQAMARYTPAGAVPEPLTDAGRVLANSIMRPDRWTDATIRRDCHTQMVAALERGGLSATEEMAVLDGLINEWFQHGDAELTRHVERWSERLITLGPDIDTVQGTRGGVLVSLGRYSEGQALLLSLRARLKSADFDRVMTEVLLARAALGLRQQVDARRWIDAATATAATAGYVKGQLAILDKVEAEVAAAEQSRTS